MAADVVDVVGAATRERARGSDRRGGGIAAGGPRVARREMTVTTTGRRATARS
jgi:hypothetical protein